MNMYVYFVHQKKSVLIKLCRRTAKKILSITLKGGRTFFKRLHKWKNTNFPYVVEKKEGIFASLIKKTTRRKKKKEH